MTNLIIWIDAEPSAGGVHKRLLPALAYINGDDYLAARERVALGPIRLKQGQAGVRNFCCRWIWLGQPLGFASHL